MMNKMMNETINDFASASCEAASINNYEKIYSKNTKTKVLKLGKGCRVKATPRI